MRIRVDAWLLLDGRLLPHRHSGAQLQGHASLSGGLHRIRIGVAPGLPESAEWREHVDGGTKVLVHTLASPPTGLLEVLLRSGSRGSGPPVHVATALEDGIWLCAIGSQAERAVRNSLGCLRGAEQLSVRASYTDREAGAVRPTPIVPQREVFSPHGVAAGMVTAKGLRAFRGRMP